ncbi:hypothetical protein H920_18903 [Fukomys damarensis]|uniref:Uncharacterized protein n=1 Tax=Fukomys damarensis TaxID=885580 RepID=A0A091CQY1_FUKDA|nr:hypothetical protein H920_18903 [Fukomys damarensis]
MTLAALESMDSHLALRDYGGAVDSASGLEGQGIAFLGTVLTPGPSIKAQSARYSFCFSGSHLPQILRFPSGTVDMHITLLQAFP